MPTLFPLYETGVGQYLSKTRDCSSHSPPCRLQHSIGLISHLSVIASLYSTTTSHCSAISNHNWNLIKYNRNILFLTFRLKPQFFLVLSLVQLSWAECYPDGLRVESLFQLLFEVIVKDWRLLFACIVCDLDLLLNIVCYCSRIEALLLFALWGLPFVFYGYYPRQRGIF